VQVGLALPGGDDFASRAVEIEDDGFDHVACGEHVFSAGPTSNALITLAAAAAVTSRIGLLSSIALLPLYPPALLAKQVATLDRISAGRFELGVGVGGEQPAEFEAVGVEVSTRFRRAEESLRVLRLLFSGQEVTFDGEFTRIPGLALDPGPIRAGGPPIWMAGRKPAGMRRVGRLADVWLPYLVTPQRYAEGLEVVRRAAVEHGRSPGAITGGLFVWTCVGADAARARREGVEWVSQVYRQDFSELADRYLLLGSPDQVISRLGEFRDAGVDRVVLQLTGADTARRSMIELLAEQVLPALR
jgi:probable F420-dependent oxidoreductase